jgi:hypothetical protein
MKSVDWSPIQVEAWSSTGSADFHAIGPISSSARSRVISATASGCSWWSQVP